MRIRLSASSAVVALCALLICTGFASHDDLSAPASAGTPITAGMQYPKHAECLVCKKNADLACIDVDVNAKTPFADYNGRRYYFCSDECRSDFVKNPAKYAKGR